LLFLEIGQGADGVGKKAVIVRGDKSGQNGGRFLADHFRRFQGGNEPIAFQGGAGLTKQTMSAPPALFADAFGESIVWGELAADFEGESPKKARLIG
jgi:hypothetical protein